MALPESAVGMSVADEANIDAYFERIGFAGSIAPSLDTLSQLHQLHPAVIPFENLDPLLGAPVRLELANLQQKLLFDHRGGYCLEHNLLFKAVLASLDFEVKVHAARVLWNDPDNTADPSHLVLTVTIAAATYLVDVGFGGLTLTAPMRLRAEVEQPTPHEVFRLVGGDPAWTARGEARRGVPAGLRVHPDRDRRRGHRPDQRARLVQPVLPRQPDRRPRREGPPPGAREPEAQDLSDRRRARGAAPCHRGGDQGRAAQPTSTSNCRPTSGSTRCSSGSWLASRKPDSPDGAGGGRPQ